MTRIRKCVAYHFGGGFSIYIGKRRIPRKKKKQIKKQLEKNKKTLSYIMTKEHEKQINAFREQMKPFYEVMFEEFKKKQIEP